MKQTHAVLLTSFAGALLFAQSPSSQQPPAAPAAAPGQTAPGRGGFGRGGQPFDYADNEGWISLFDGQTLNGWDGDTRF
jgi:hypothetical protein